VIFSPAFETVTIASNNAVHSYVIPYIKSPWVITLLEKGGATRKNLEDALEKVNPSIVWLDSHGDETCLAAETECAADLDNANLFAGRIVYILACLCGKKLAPAMVEKGARAVLAFTDVVVLEIDAKTLTITRPFLETLYYPRRLYDYISVGQVYDETIRKYNEWIDCLKVWDVATFDALLHNRDCFKLFGDPSAVVQSPSQLVASAERAVATATVATLLVRFFLIATLRAVLGRK
jgi:hypothetical protein